MIKAVLCHKEFYTGIHDTMNLLDIASSSTPPPQKITESQRTNIDVNSFHTTDIGEEVLVYSHARDMDSADIGPLGNKLHPSVGTLSLHLIYI